MIQYGGNCLKHFPEGLRVAASTNKKVMVERFDRSALPGYAHKNAFLTPDAVEIMGVNGTLTRLERDQIKAVLFVRELTESLEMPPWIFHARPKINGLWVRLKFRDGESREAMMANNLLDLTADGILVTPPHLAGNVMQAFVLRAALVEVSVLGVIGSPLRRPAVVRKGAQQIDLFGAES